MDHVTVMATSRPFLEGLDGRHLLVVLVAAFTGCGIGVLGTWALAAHWRAVARRLHGTVRELRGELAAYEEEAEQRSRELLAQLPGEDARAGAAA